MKQVVALIILFFSLNSFSQSVPAEDTNIYDVTHLEIKPDRPDGLDESLRKAGLEKKAKTKAVSVFVVEKDGSLSDIKIYGKTDSHKSEELIRILKSTPNWTPGKQNGKLVRVKYALPFD